MKIAVLGSRGFVGSNLAKHLSFSYDVTPITRDTLNLLDGLAVRNYLKKHNFDVIVNCAATMTNNETLDDARNNLGIFINFYDNKDLFGKFINTASGAEFDRSTSIDNALEKDIFNRMPKDSYGWGQNIKSRLCVHTPKFYNIRIFNCFGIGEMPTRIFSRFLSDGKIEIINDRYFDYFSIDDLKIVVKHCIENNWSFKDINAVYEKKYKISEVLKMFCDLNSLESNYSIISESNNNYTGSALLLKALNIKLKGLEMGLINYIQRNDNGSL